MNRSNHCPAGQVPAGSRAFVDTVSNQLSRATSNKGYALQTQNKQYGKASMQSSVEHLEQQVKIQRRQVATKLTVNRATTAEHISRARKSGAESCNQQPTKDSQGLGNWPNSGIRNAHSNTNSSVHAIIRNKFTVENVADHHQLPAQQTTAQNARSFNYSSQKWKYSNLVS